MQISGVLSLGLLLLNAVTVRAAGAESRFSAGVASATPPGITLRTVSVGGGVNQPVDHLVFADAQGRTFYYSDADRPGKSSCSAACLEKWRPVPAAAGSRAGGLWSIIKRDDGSRQWVFRDRAVYTCANDSLPKESPVDYSDSQFVIARGAACEGMDGHHIATLEPSAWMTLPAGIVVGEVLTAPGMVLTNAQGLPLYSFAGDPDQDGELRSQWIAYVAPQAALSVDRFRVIARRDGSFQWAYRGKALYLFKGDETRGDSNGRDVDRRLQLAMVLQYFMPPQVVIRKDQRRGGVLVTAIEGRTLYARDRARQDRAGNRNARGGDRGDLGIGQWVGTDGCDEQCEKARIPLIAPVDAQPSGYWSIFTRRDGARQWAYQGYALYTYNAEEPGETTGSALYDFTINHGSQSLPASTKTMGFYWRVSSP